MFNQISESGIEQLAKLLNVLADPIRMQIVLTLTTPASISNLQRQLEIGQISLLRHLNQMQDSGLLLSKAENGEVFYSLVDLNLYKGVRLLTAEQ